MKEATEYKVLSENTTTGGATMAVTTNNSNNKDYNEPGKK